MKYRHSDSEIGVVNTAKFNTFTLCKHALMFTNTNIGATGGPVIKTFALYSGVSNPRGCRLCQSAYSALVFRGNLSATVNFFSGDPDVIRIPVLLAALRPLKFTFLELEQPHP